MRYKLECNTDAAPSFCVHTMYSGLLLLFSAFITGALALSSPPSGAITVGNGGKYSTLSAALKDTSSSVSTTNRTAVTCPTLIACAPPDVLHLLRNVHGHRHHHAREHHDLRADEHPQLLHRQQYAHLFFLPSCSPVSRPARPSIERLTTAVSTPATPAVTITNDIPASQAGSNDASGTVQVHASGVSLYNLNIENTYGKVRT